LDKVSGLDTTVPFTVGGTAKGAGQDYSITASPVVIPEGSLSVDIIITVNDDSLYEADETVVVTMGTPVNADKGTPDVHTATILDDDAGNKPTVSFDPASQSGAEDVGTMAVTVQLDKVSGLDTTVPFTVGGTATEGAGQDYTITASPVVIPEGSLSVDIIITVNEDNLTEDPETVVVTMGTPVNADKGTPNVHTATILASVCICPSDGYEGDDFAAQAIGLNMGGPQPHDFCDDAIDWTTFTVQAGSVYTITTSSWGQRADTFLALFDTDASTLLAANDDYDGAPETDYSSRIVWQAPADGDYYVRTTNRAGLTGCATDYDLLIEEQAQQEPEMVFIYLPIVMRDYGGGSATVEGADIRLDQASGNDVHPMGVINHTCPDDYETDDTLEQAHAIEADKVQVHSFDSDTGHYAADKDSVWFDVSAGCGHPTAMDAIT